VSHYACRDQPVGTITIGLIEEYHYVGLERLQTVNHQEKQSSQGSRRVKDTDNKAEDNSQQSANETPLSANEAHHSANEAYMSTKSQPDADQQCNQLDQEDEEAQRELVQIRGCLLKVVFRRKMLSQMATNSTLLLLVRVRHP